MKVTNRALSLFLVSMLFSGCTVNHDKLGISSLEWSSLAPEKQRALITNYKKIAAEQAKFGKKISGKPSLMVTISKGEVMFPPLFINWQKYRPVSFVLAKGECRTIPVVSTVNQKCNTELTACYLENLLTLDRSRYDSSIKIGSVNIYSSPLWLDGFIYKGVNSNGYVRFSNVNIEVKQEKL
jgi:hypothetical protein